MVYKFFNMLFRLSLIFLICLIWFRYFVKDFSLSIIYTSLTTIVIEILIHAVYTKKLNKLDLKSKELALANQIGITFALDKQKAIEFLFSLAIKKHQCEKRKNYIIIKNKDINNKSLKNILYPYFKLDCFFKSDLINIFESLKNIKFNKLIIISNSFSKDVYPFVKSLNKNIILLNNEEAYLKLYKNYNYFPNELIELKNDTKIKIKEILALSLNKKRSKGYFFASLILLISSFFFRMNLYYLICSSILLLLCLVSYFLPKYNIFIPEEIL